MKFPGQLSPDKPLPPILVVDDEEIVLAALKETLRRADFNVVPISDPLQALEEIKQREFSAVITDQSMPGLTGLELLGHARELQPYATRILVTAVLDLDTVIDSINKGEIYRFIVKPWLREEFLNTVKNAVQRYELICQNAYLQQTTQSMNEQLVELNRSLEQQVQLVAQQNQQLADVNQALARNFVRSMELCVHTMETFYPSLGNQARRVSQLCKSLGQVLELSAEENRVLESAALLHDIGLVGVPRQIIRRWQNEPESLSSAEKVLIEQHPILGQELAGFTSDLVKVGEVIRAHHERFDGSGYPDQLAGENIPWLARLLAIAVAYASSPLTDMEAVEKIKLSAGAWFDPEAVRAFLKALTVTSVPRKEREIGLPELRPGMVLARGIYTTNGLLLVPEGQRLNATFIEKLLNHNRIQPITQSLIVYC
ncbi:MAG TPA: HD domain-containing phosphohydrolase [Verrucomicrobiae bacterium]|jgi:response regulator RpfG family c-di-GMP phosphodiesterase|nr:HD domain-containing phosphohydrolase [Verrucomicrobiae bacterium]